MEQTELNDKLIYEYLKDPRVMSAAALSALTYMRASDVHSLLNRWIAYVRQQQGLDSTDVGVSNFWKVIATIPFGFSGWGIAETADRVLIKNEIHRLKEQYASELRVYEVNKPRWDARESLLEPVQPEVLTFEQWIGGDFSSLSPTQLIKARLDYQIYFASKQADLIRYNRMYDHWLATQNMEEPIMPTPDPAIAAWNAKGEVTQQDAATYALIAFIIGLNPSIVPEALKGVGEIVKGIGEIVPL